MTIGARLREERMRLGISQTDLATICSVAKNTQLNYEKDERSPDALYLVSAHDAGVDVMYVLFGRRDPALGAQTGAEAEVICSFRSLNAADQAVVRRVSTGLAEMNTGIEEPTEPSD